MCWNITRSIITFALIFHERRYIPLNWRNGKCCCFLRASLCEYAFRDSPVKGVAPLVHLYGIARHGPWNATIRLLYSMYYSGGNDRFRHAGCIYYANKTRILISIDGSGSLTCACEHDECKDYVLILRSCPCRTQKDITNR